MVEPADDGAWFAPKRFGYGAGRPIVWQGWAALTAHLLVIAVGAVIIRNNPLALGTWIVFAALIPVPLYRARTRGGWKWRWGMIAD